MATPRFATAVLSLSNLAVLQVTALDNGVGQRPGLGWNSDYCTNCSHPSDANGFGGENFIKLIADYMHGVRQPGAASGLTLQQLGFHYVNMDASWDTPERDSAGKLVPDPMLWPSGLAHTVSYVHSLGLGFGLYGDRGKLDCAKNPGNLGHETSDAGQYAAWEIDWYKTDSCYSTNDHAAAVQEYATMRDALNATGRTVWLALCGWQNWYAPPDPSIHYAGGKSLGNSWRTGPDTGTGWTSVITNIKNALAVSVYTGPTAHGGGWNDGSLQLTPGMGCHTKSHQPPLASDNCMTNDRHRTQYSAWCMLAMNLMLVGNFSALNTFVMETWTNPEILSINQDPLGKAAVSLHASVAKVAAKAQDSAAGYNRATLAECGGEPALQQWVMDETGRISNAKARVCINVEGCKTALIYDGCTTNSSTACGKNEQFAFDKNQRLVSALPGFKCIVEAADHTLSISPCGSDRPSQHFQLKDGQLTDEAGLCLTASTAPAPAPSSGTHIAMGRRLSGDSMGVASGVAASTAMPGFAVMFINNDVTGATMSCEADCLRSLGLEPSQKYSIRDVWSHAEVGQVTGDKFVVSAAVPAGGGSRVFRLVKQARGSLYV